MNNLLEETLEKLKQHSKSWEEVYWVGNRAGTLAVSWHEFVPIANTEYNNGYGANEIVRDLVVVGNDWWLSRGEYDGSEWWDYNERPVLLNRDYKSFTTVKDKYNIFADELESANREREVDAE